MNKKTLLFALAVFILAVFSFFAGGFLTKKPETTEILKELEIFVAEEVLVAEKENLDQFFALWKNAKNGQYNFEQCKELALNDGGRFKNIPILKVGQETLYGNDLNYLFLFYHYQNYTTDSRLSDEIFNEVVDIAMTDSILLQEVEKQGLVTLDSSFFNNQNKNYALRNQKINLAKEKLSDKLVQKISGEAVAIWFNNNKVPISVEEGKKLARAKIEVIYQKLKSGEIDFRQAAELIRQDNEIEEKIDPDYKNNAYYTFEAIERDTPVFSFEQLNKELWSLGESQISKIITAGETNPETGAVTENLFIVIKVNKRTGETNNSSTQELVDNLSQSDESYERQNLTTQ